MIGVIVVGHVKIASESVRATNQIIPELKNFIAVDVAKDEPPTTIRERISKAIEELNNCNGIIILTDMFGGTPSNVCLSFLSKPSIDVISGFNLPMLIKLASFGENATLEDITSFIQQYGRKNIVIASHVLSGNVLDE